MPAHHKLEQFLDEYLDAAGTGDHNKIPLFRLVACRTGKLTDRPMHRVDAYAMVRRRTAEAGLKGKLGCPCSGRPVSPPTSRPAAPSKTPGPAAHESPRTTKLYYRTSDEITLDEAERITISRVLANPT